MLEAKLFLYNICVNLNTRFDYLMFETVPTLSYCILSTYDDGQTSEDGKTRQQKLENMVWHILFLKNLCILQNFSHFGRAVVAAQPFERIDLSVKMEKIKHQTVIKYLILE